MPRCFSRYFEVHVDHSYWIGGRDDVIEGTWQWASSNRIFNFTSWARGKPNNHDGNEDCFEMDINHHFEWNDQDCLHTQYFVCELNHSQMRNYLRLMKTLTAKCINQEPPAKKPRFKELPSKEEIEKLALARTEPRTNQQTVWGVKLLRGWLTENKYSSSFEELDETILNDRLCYFYASLLTKQGTDYSKSALVGIRSAISRHITGPPYNREINIITDKSFMPSNHVITGKLSPRCTAFFQQALQYPKPTIWYAAQPIGKNKLASMMSRISEEAGLSIRYTNHCLRATVATGLKKSGSR
ncbi:unnamed protein product [Mytilus coruscus]|uniref:C-type lectin domain-containing protein n=1 Tax=Mytilus coruscus TaxID=42192 RepID=A0A6J8BEN2_MYTCO|nr:unnamed protein product [Mytilus coruscus]